MRPPMIHIPFVSNAEPPDPSAALVLVIKFGHYEMKATRILADENRVFSSNFKGSEKINI